MRRAEASGIERNMTRFIDDENRRLIAVGGGMVEQQVPTHFRTEVIEIRQCQIVHHHFERTIQGFHVARKIGPERIGEAGGDLGGARLGRAAPLQQNPPAQH